MTKRSLSAKQVAARLGVRVETVYSYVSREILSRQVGPDGRTSRFDAAEVEVLARRGRPRRGTRRVGSVDVSLATSLTSISAQGRLAYRGLSVPALAGTCGYEQVAELLWTGELPDRARWPDAPDAAALRVARALPKGSPPVERLAVVAASIACSRSLRVDLREQSVIRHARTLIKTFVACLPLATHPPRPASSAPSIAAQLWPRLSPRRASRARVAALDTALLLLADHELATSTLAARLAASTRADPFLCVLAGLAAVSGSLHGRAPAAAQRLLHAAAAAAHPEVAVAEALAGASGALPGFGHPVYQVEDPRAPVLLERVMAMAAAHDRKIIDAVRDAAADQSSVPMNGDFALGALGFAGKMPLGSSEAIFAIARTAGWIAHTLEEYGEAPLRFRARAIYDGAGESG